MPSPPGFTFAVFAFTKEFAIFEILPDNKGLRFIGSHPEMPEDAAWQDSPNGNGSVATAKAVLSRRRATPS